ncbi:MAG TPA: efflux RND transporter periplasmic adaptor subunit [Myxococcales bacterium]|nr:efflux RND transporter periplasmic adaptor subunit [Myxococcales bacterium]
MPVTVAKVQQKNVPLNVRAIGNVEPITSVTVRAQVGGVLQRVGFSEGQEVKKGDLLFEIDPRPLQAAQAQAEALLERDRASAQDAEATAKRYAALVKKEYVTQQQADNAEAQAQALRAAVVADQAAVQQARLNLAYAQIRSPVSGRTGSLLVHPGNVVKANDDKLVVIDQLQPIYVGFSVPEQVLPQIRARGVSARLPVSAVPSTATPGNNPEQRASGTMAQERQAGVLTFVDNAVDPQTGTIRLKGTFTNKDETLWPGQFVDVELTLGEQQGAIVAPAEAVQRGQQGEFVFVVKSDQTVESRAVTVSRSDPHEAVIEKGLQPGETVVTDGQLRLQQGMKVQIKGEAGS